MSASVPTTERSAAAPASQSFLGSVRSAVSSYFFGSRTVQPAPVGVASFTPPPVAPSAAPSLVARASPAYTGPNRLPTLCEDVFRWTCTYLSTRDRLALLAASQSTRRARMKVMKALFLSEFRNEINQICAAAGPWSLPINFKWEVNQLLDGYIKGTRNTLQTLSQLRAKALGLLCRLPLHRLGYVTALPRDALPLCYLQRPLDTSKKFHQALLLHDGSREGHRQRRKEIISISKDLDLHHRFVEAIEFDSATSHLLPSASTTTERVLTTVIVVPPDQLCGVNGKIQVIGDWELRTNYRRVLAATLAQVLPGFRITVTRKVYGTETRWTPLTDPIVNLDDPKIERQLPKITLNPDAELCIHYPPHENVGYPSLKHYRFYPAHHGELLRREGVITEYRIDREHVLGPTLIICKPEEYLEMFANYCWYRARDFEDFAYANIHCLMAGKGEMARGAFQCALWAQDPWQLEAYPKAKMFLKTLLEFGTVKREPVPDID